MSAMVDACCNIIVQDGLHEYIVATTSGMSDDGETLIREVAKQVYAQQEGRKAGELDGASKIKQRLIERGFRGSQVSLL